jgi:hypothetical protein
LKAEQPLKNRLKCLLQLLRKRNWSTKQCGCANAAMAIATVTNCSP